MNVSDLKNHIGKHIHIDYFDSIENSTASVSGEILTVENNVICLGLNLLPSDSNENLRLKKGPLIKLININAIKSFVFFSESEKSKEGFISIGNCTRYCTYLIEGIFHKSNNNYSDFYNASNEYVQAMKNGIVTDEIMTLYINTTKDFITNIVNDRIQEDPNYYCKEIEKRLNCLKEFENFISSDISIFQFLSNYTLHSILLTIFILKCFTHSNLIFEAIYKRYSKDLLSHKDGIVFLLGKPKICGSLLIFALQTEAIYNRSMARRSDDDEEKQSYINKQVEIDSLINKATAIIDELKSNPDSSITDNSKLLNLRENLVSYYTNVEKKSNNVDMEYNSLLFRLIFNKIQKEIDKTNKIGKSNRGALDAFKLKNFYDMSMAQLYNLFKYIKVFKKSPEDEIESIWQLALDLMNLYSKKLELISSDTEEYERYKRNKSKDIKSDILNKIEEYSGTTDYFKTCKPTKLQPISEHLYNFNIFDKYIGLSSVLLDSDEIYPDCKALCHLRLATIYYDKEKYSEFKKNFEKGESLYQSSINQQSIYRNSERINQCKLIYNDLKGKFDYEFLKWIELNDKIKSLRDKAIVSFNTEELNHLSKKLQKTLNDYENFLTSESFISFEKKSHLNVTGSSINDILKELLPYIDDDSLDSNNFVTAEKLSRTSGMSFDIAGMRNIREGIKKKISNHSKNIETDLYYKWTKLIDKFSNFQNTSYLKRKFFSKLDELKSLSENDRCNILRKVLDRSRFKDSKNLIKLNTPLFLNKAETLHIHNHKLFHDILIKYCEIDLFQNYQSDKISTAKACLFIAEHPASSETNDDLKRFCEVGMLNCKEKWHNPETDRDEDSIDWQKLNNKLKELNTKPVQYLDLLREMHDPKSVVSTLHVLFGYPKLIKFIWHDCPDTVEIFKWTDPNGKEVNSYATFLEHAKEVVKGYSNKELPEDLLKDLRLFLSIDNKDEKGETSSYGWNNLEWQEWLNKYANSSLDPNKPINKFPGYNDIQAFRSNFRCQSSNALQELLKSLCDAYWTKHKDIDYNFCVEQEEEPGTISVMTWLPRIEKIIFRIFDDIYQLATGGRTTKSVADEKIKVYIKIKINKSTNSIKLIHMNSDASKTVEEFIDKLQIEGGALAEIAKMCLNLVDYAVESKWKDGSASRIPILSTSEAETIPVNAYDIEGFTHILYLYRDKDYSKADFKDNNKIRKPKRR